MFTAKDIAYRSVFVINCLENRALRVSNGSLLLQDVDKKKTLTKLPFQKILALFVIGHITVTTPLIDQCTKNGIPLVVMKPNFRPVFFFSITAEANFLLRKRQYENDKNDLEIPRILVANKLQNQLILLNKVRLKTLSIEKARIHLRDSIDRVTTASDYDTIMGLEGRAAKSFFNAYFEKLDWKSRCPRTRIDPVNATLDIGYTILFNYIEVFIRLFGFDPYIGVYHRLWFKRKSLVCDLVEPFRCLVDHQVLKAFNLGQCKNDDFKIFKNEFLLKHERNSDYTRMFFELLIEQKILIFKYIRDYYRCFMRNCDSSLYPKFLIK
jgi:CRISPR-associated endonuclease Cas1